MYETPVVFTNVGMPRLPREGENHTDLGRTAKEGLLFVLCIYNKACFLITDGSGWSLCFFWARAFIFLEKVTGPGLLVQRSPLSTRQQVSFLSGDSCRLPFALIINKSSLPRIGTPCYNTKAARTRVRGVSTLIFNTSSTQYKLHQKRPYFSSKKQYSLY